MKRVSDVKRYITQNYGVDTKLFEVVKIGPRTYIYIVTKDGELGRGLIFTGAIETTESSKHLKEYLTKNIESVLRKYKYLD